MQGIPWRSVTWRELCLVLGFSACTLPKMWKLEVAAVEWGEGPANDTMGSNSRARAELGWRPHERSLIEEIERGYYAQER